MNRFLESENIDSDGFKRDKNNAIIINNISQVIYSGGERYEYNGPALKDLTGNRIDIKMTGMDTEGVDENTTEKTMSLNVYAMTQDVPYGLKAVCTDSIVVLVNRSFIDDKDKLWLGQEALFKTNDSTKFMEQVDRETAGTDKDEIYIYNGSREYEQMNNMLFVISVFTYGFIILMTLICIANIFNTITTSFSLRKREFAMLKSVGMTDKSFRKMIACESAFYGIKALIFGLPVATVIVLLIKKQISEAFMPGAGWPVGAYIIAVLGVFVTIGITMLYSAGKIRKQNVIDALKDENI